MSIRKKIHWQEWARCIPPIKLTHGHWNRHRLISCLHIIDQ